MNPRGCRKLSGDMDGFNFQWGISCLHRDSKFSIGLRMAAQKVCYEKHFVQYWNRNWTVYAHFAVAVDYHKEANTPLSLATVRQTSGPLGGRRQRQLIKMRRRGCIRRTRRQRQPGGNQLNVSRQRLSRVPVTTGAIHRPTSALAGKCRHAS